jgi:hypothetical protein
MQYLTYSPLLFLSFSPIRILSLYSVTPSVLFISPLFSFSSPNSFIVFTREIGRVIAQGASWMLPGFDHRSGHVGFMVDEVALGQFFPSTSVSPASSHSTSCSVFINHSIIDTSLFTESVVK